MGNKSWDLNSGNPVPAGSLVLVTGHGPSVLPWSSGCGHHVRVFRVELCLLKTCFEV